MKVKCIYQNGDLKQEGLTKVVTKLNKSLEKEGIEFTENPEEADIIHIHSSGFLLAKKFSKYKDKCIYTLYSDIDEDFIEITKNHIEYFTKFYNKNHNVDKAVKNAVFSTLSTLIPLKFKKKYLEKLRKVVLVNSHLATKLDLPNSTTIPIGIDTEKFYNKNLENNKLTIAFFGHNAPLKGLNEVVDSFSDIRDERIKLKIFLSKFSKRTEKIAKNKNKKIEVFGHLDNIEEEYNKSDIIILPYRSKTSSIGIPLVLIEAMACERPIITTNLEYINNIAKNSVIYVNPYSSDQIKEKIKKLINDSDLRTNLGKKAREIILKDHKEEDMVKSYVKLYEKLKFS